MVNHEVNHDWHPRHPKDELVSMAVLTCEEFGFLQRLRDWSWVNGGIPADEDFVQRLAKTFQVSMYKFKKLWQRVKNFFAIRDECFVFEPDEQERRAQVVNIAKSRYFGKLGALKRWAKTVNEAQPDPIPPPCPPYPETMANNNRQLQEELHPPPPPPTGPGEMVGGGLELVISESQYQAVCQRAVNLGLAAPTRGLAQQLLRNFAGDLDALLSGLVRWEGQQNTGLWATKSRTEFELEAARQRIPRNNFGNSYDHEKALAAAGGSEAVELFLQEHEQSLRKENQSEQGEQVKTAAR